MNKRIIDKLLQSPEPIVRFKTLTRILGKSDRAAAVSRAKQEIQKSPLVQNLLVPHFKKRVNRRHPYNKWTGAHWVLSTLADLDYTPGDKLLMPLKEETLAWLLSEDFVKRCLTIIDGRARRCASQEGNALFSMNRLGIADDRANQLAARLLDCQWPDGGWNCDKRPEAKKSSFMESLIPLRALALHARITRSRKAREAARRAAEVFLKRRLYKRRSDGKNIKDDFTLIHYPCYWRYDILFGLKVMAEAGFINDPRCGDALDLLESKRLPDGGFPAEKKYYQTRDPQISGFSTVDWGGASKRRSNDFVTLDALFVLKAAGRLSY